MMPVRISPRAQRNQAIVEHARLDGESNLAWFQRVHPQPVSGVTVLLVGGCNLTSFRLRTAQSHMRIDMFPSFWSHAGIMVPSTPKKSIAWVWEASIEPTGGFHACTARNGIARVELAEYDSPDRYPNIAFLRFPGADPKEVVDGIEILKKARLVVDLVSPLVEWLGYAWGAQGNTNPLLRGHAVPSAAFVEQAFGQARCDVTPGTDSSSTCPEALWQAALWWSEFYGQTTNSNRKETSGTPTGIYVVSQPAAAATRE